MADSKITALTANTTPLITDIMAIVDDPGGTPLSQKITLQDLARLFVPRGHLWGLTMSNAADTANDITVAAGEAKDEANTENMILSASITKRLDAAWTVGDNQGGLNTGAEANSTWYEVHLIKRVDTGVVDVMFTTTANRATLPTNYTLQRRIGWIRNDAGGAILQFTQVNDLFTLTTQINDVAATLTSTAAQVTLTVPPNTVARFRAAMTAGTGGTNLLDQTIVFSEIVEGNVTPAVGTGIASLTGGEFSAGVVTNSAGHFLLKVNSSSQIEHDSSANAQSAAGTFDISTFGWIDDRLRLSST